MLTADQTRRVHEALTETMELLEKWTNQKTFDDMQEQKKQDRIAEYKAHAEKLMGMLA